MSALSALRCLPSPIRLADLVAGIAHAASSSFGSLYLPIKDRSHEFFAHFTHLDYARAMAFNAIGKDTVNMLGVVRLHTSTDEEMAEFAILLRSDLKGRGLEWL
jgi:hypothetical protein